MQDFCFSGVSGADPEVCDDTGAETEHGEKDEPRTGGEKTAEENGLRS